MTTTGTRRPSAAPQRLLMALLAALLLCGIFAGPAPADPGGAPPDGGASVTVPEPGTLVFVAAAGLALFARRRERTLR